MTPGSASPVGSGAGDGRLPAILLIGPTATGKDSAACALAERVGAEVISLDSMKVFRGMEVATDKPTADERRRVRHHLIDVLEPHESFDLVRYLALAARAEEEIRARGRRPMYAGGTALYARALLLGLDPVPPAPPALRARLEDEAQREGTPALHARLAALDPARAAEIAPADRRRVVRALEILETTGCLPSTLRERWRAPAPRADLAMIGVVRPRPEVNRRIDARVRRYFASGLVDEVRAIRAGKGFSAVAAQALCYRETLAHLGGALTLEQAVSAAATHTRRFAKRQMTWFRRFSGVRWLVIDGDPPAEATADRLAALLDLPAERAPLPAGVWEAGGGAKHVC
ncbi:MAG: tRNA (adenosine(37)-N6)-dimethylallyltransferase MiaA [Planctomycetes bacterium]|nr:tRNA (adenosine(37)-N6)-dimethylallyltransferase MiaA [Planctomycetota bacterium]